MAIILGLESSCDETAAALVRSDRTVLAHALAGQEDHHRAFGGVVPQAYSGAYIDDTLYIGGSFNGVGGVTVANIAQWSAASGAWLPVGQGIQASSQWDGVFSMAVHPVTKDLYVGGQFAQPVGGSTSMGGIVKWDYTDDTWYAVGTGLTGGNTDALANLELGNCRTNCGDLTNDFVPWHHWENTLEPLIPRLVDIGVANTGVKDLDGNHLGGKFP